MKNISRRVFIKGMAVAAVATAASTVLAGCNVPVTPDDPTEPAATNVLSFANPDKSSETMTITGMDMIKGNGTFGAKNDVAIKVKVENKVGKDLYVYTTGSQSEEQYIVSTYAPGSKSGVYNTGKDSYYVVVSAYMNGETGSPITIDFANTSYVFGYNHPTHLSNGQTAIDTIVFKGVPSSCKSITLKYQVKKIVDLQSSFAKSTVKVMETETFTYNL